MRLFDYIIVCKSPDYKNIDKSINEINELLKKKLDLLEKEYNLVPKSPNKLQVEIIFLDVLTTKKNVSVFHSNAEEVVIRMRGIMVVNGKKGKPVVVEESSSEISMSTLLIDEGGKFNQTSLSNALKKACGSLINKLSE